MKRQEELIRILLKSEKPLTTTELAKQLSVSSRTIRSDLEKIESELLVHHLCLEKKPHVGVWIQGAKEDKIALFLNVDQQNDTANTYSKDYRIGCILVQILLGNSKIYPDKFADELYVSRSTIEKDLSVVSQWLKKHQLELAKNANNGLYVKGNEEDIRNGLEEKLDALVRHELYTKYKTAPSEEEQEKARQEYLDKRGVSASYRW